MIGLDWRVRKSFVDGRMLKTGSDDRSTTIVERAHTSNKGLVDRLRTYQ